MITQQLAAHVASLHLDAIPASAREAAKRFLLDGIGCLLAGGRNEPARMAASLVRELGTVGGPSTVFLDGTAASPRDAAFVNATSLYSVALNDVHKAAGAHPGGCVIPALLAMAERQQVAGADLLAAMVAGYDVMGRLGEAVMPAHRAQGFHPSGTLGPFASTAAVGRLLGFDASMLASALGIAGSQAAGLVCFQTDATLTILYHVGRAARDGVEACLLARQGFAGPRTVLEDPRGGFLATLAPRHERAALTQDLGHRFAVDETSARPFYGCSYTIAASSATHAILRRHPQRRAEDVDAVTVYCHPQLQREVDHPDPQGLLAARISMHFNVALVLARGDVVVGDVSEADLRDPRIRRLLPLVVFAPDERMGEWSSRVIVRFRDGNAEAAEVTCPKGDPGNPMDWPETEDKFRRLLQSVGVTQGAGAVIEAVHTLDGGTASPLLAALGRAAAEARAA